MQRVAQQRYRARRRHHGRLEQRGGTEHGKGDPQRPDTLRAGLQRRIHLVRGRKRVRAQHVPQPRKHTPKRTTMLVILAVAMAVTTSAALRLAHA